ncbi:DUF1643 domain-containing protein [Paenibacillus sp. sgz500958]|uniref:DUF1643 domain-containing protein n=1 Tax=Paenibacillus sp. sgz500958 TaxID=3242475 RepID=UPI0036D24117
MNHIQAQGTFIRSGALVFRTKAELRFREGNGQRLLLIGLNPGSCQLLHKHEWASFLEQEMRSVTGDIALDPTMKQIVNIIEEAVPAFSGNLHILNLFNLRNGNIDNALQEYSKLKLDPHILPLLETDFKRDIIFSQYSCVWLGWSQHSHSELNLRKKSVRQYLALAGTPVLARFRNDNSKDHHVWHFKPQMKNQSDEYRNYIVPLLSNHLMAH